MASARAYACARQHTSQRGQRCDSRSTSASQPASACARGHARARACLRARESVFARLPAPPRACLLDYASPQPVARQRPSQPAGGLAGLGWGCLRLAQASLDVLAPWHRNSWWHTQAVARLKQHGSGHRGGAPPRAARHARRSSPQRTRTLNSPCRCGCPYCRVHCRASTVSAPTAASRSCQSCRAATLRAEREAGSFAVRGFAGVSFRDSRPYRNVLAVVFAAAI